MDDFDAFCHTHRAVFFYSFHKLQIEVVLAGILWLHTNYNADAV